MSDFDTMDEDALSSKSVTSLQKDVTRDVGATRILDQIIKEREQRHWQRQLLFWAVMIIVPVSLLATLVMMVVLVSRGVGDIVYVAFISAMAVQAFALIATLARNLYQREPQIGAQAGDDAPQ